MKIPVEWDVEELKSIINTKHGFAFNGKFFTDKPKENVVLTPSNIRVGGGLKLTNLNIILESIQAKLRDSQTNTPEVQVPS